MTRYAGGAACVGLVALALGCEPAKELPTNAPVQGDAQAQTQAPAPPAPDKTEPGAKEVLDKALAALTGGKPELLGKVRVSRAKLKGQAYIGNQWLESERTYAAAWPDRLYATNEAHPFGNKLLIESWLRRPDLTVFANGTPNPQPVSEVVFATDLTGQYWMALLVPATDPKAVAFDREATAVGDRRLNRVSLAVGGLPPYRLTFDARTDALLRVEYGVRQFDVARRTTMVFADHTRHPDGLLLPNRMECLYDGTAVEKWAVERWEFPPAIPDAEFSPPKKK
ncbi:MAG: hypothetical protein K2V38_15440 [Gemmataceae bacterium]|nr:hypothetical protein [Gemmataceae bacterium]